MGTLTYDQKIADAQDAFLQRVADNLVKHKSTPRCDVCGRFIQIEAVRLGMAIIEDVGDDEPIYAFSHMNCDRRKL